MIVYKILVKNKYTIVRWSNSNKKYYIKLGYVFTKMGDSLKVKVEDLQKGSNVHLDFICPVCGREFSTTYQSVVLRKSSCCKSCRQITDLTDRRFGRIKVVSFYKSINKKAVWECKCDCGNTKYISGPALLNKSVQSCGCLNKELSSARMRGKNNPMYGKRGEISPNWNPNLTNEERVDNRDYLEYYRWRDKVKERDKKTCQVCGEKRRRQLTVHHLKDYSNHPKYRLSVKNGITLCKKCHKKFHKWMGGAKITCSEKDFEEWLQVISLI